jgi:hypothetical protein
VLLIRLFKLPICQLKLRESLLVPEVGF